MKFRRKADTTPTPAETGRRGDRGTTPPARPRAPVRSTCPRSRATASSGSTSARCSCPPIADRELRLQVDEPSGPGPRGAAGRPRRRVRAAGLRRPAQRRPLVRGPAADRRGHGAPRGQATEREGRWGTELVCQMPVQRPDGTDRPPSPRASSASTAPAGCCAPRSSADRPSSPTRRPRTGRTRSPRSSYAAATRRCRSASRCRSRCRTTPAGSGEPWPRRAGCAALSPWANSSEAHQRDLRQSHTPTRPWPSPTPPTASRSSSAGSLRTVTLRPRGGVPALEAELDDGSGRHHRGLARPAPDRRHRPRPVDAVAGRIGRQGGVPIMYNPRYELLP